MYKKILTKGKTIRKIRRYYLYLRGYKESYCYAKDILQK